MVKELSDSTCEHECGAPEKKKRTDAQVAASRRNGAKSHGPLDCSETRFNGWRHGLCSEHPVAVMRGEDPEMVQNKIDRYTVELGAEGEVERDLVTIAVTNFYKFTRATNAAMAAGTRTLND